MTRKIGTAMVVGAGISGIRAALDLAESGYGVTLIDRSAHIGGVLSQLDYQFPTDRCGMCKMLPLVDRDASSQYCMRKGLFHENIDILLSTELLAVEGEPGNFQVTLRQKPKWVDPERCIGCGKCVEICPVDIPDAFNEKLVSHKAIYLPVPHNIPNTYIIDTAACTRCGACEEICPTAAIQLSQEERKKFHILVVDDELIVRDSLKEILEDEGYTVETAESGPQALEKLAERPYHLMLTDIKMPGMDGVEVLQKAKADYPELTVVMMTAYATVETAVEAMKIGALDYLIKPFEEEILIPMVLRLYEDLELAQARQIEVGALVLSGGTAYFDPADGNNTFGYGVFPNVMTSLEFERIFSGTGPCRGKLVRPSDGKPIRKVAWIQCVGSRDLQSDADFCSNICCMFAIKEALVAQEKADGDLETAIYFMDMRTFGKSFQRYRDQAEIVHGVRFERGRVHSVFPQNQSGDLFVEHVDLSGNRHQETFDMVVLAVGQRPAPGTAELAELLDIPLNQWGFAQTEPFSACRTGREGILIGGSYSGLKDISESVTQASAAALNASRVIHATGGSLAPQPSTVSPGPDVVREMPRILVAVCTCGERLTAYLDNSEFIQDLMVDPAITHVEFLGQTCTEQGWEALVEVFEKHKPNRLLIGACLPYVYARKIKQLGRQLGLDPKLIDFVDILAATFSASGSQEKGDIKSVSNLIRSTLEMGIAGLKRVDPMPVDTVQIQQQALVVGGGIAGMTAALAIAEHGFPVDLVEQNENLGGNLNWIARTIEAHSTQGLLEETLQKVEKHPLIRVHSQTHVMGSYGQVGHFISTIENQEAGVQTIEHGVTILATGGSEATTTSYGYGTSDAIITQKELQEKLDHKIVEPENLKTVVMIQCVDSREEPKNYCSRVCCASALKNALYLKEQNPNVAIYILYRDMMSYGFTETYYTQARKAGVFFIQYEKDNKPRVQVGDGSVQVIVDELIIGKKIQIDADLVVLATGILSNLPQELASAYGAAVDPDGFFQEADSKWRPVDSLAEGIFACGLAHSPRSIAESVTTAEAAAQRSLRILAREHLPAGKVVAKVHHSLCSLCERCIEACPYEARGLDLDLEKILVNPVRCQGCGSCAVACPNSASYLEGFPEQQMFEVIDAALVGTFD
jgi:heterodisulfide reductase subunit A